jgi:hypothetical protein
MTSCLVEASPRAIKGSSNSSIPILPINSDFINLALLFFIYFLILKIYLIVPDPSLSKAKKHFLNSLICWSSNFIKCSFPSNI